MSYLYWVSGCGQIHMTWDIGQSNIRQKNLASLLFPLHPDHHRLFADARQCPDLLHRVAHVSFKRGVSHDDEWDGAAGFPALLDHLSDADAMVAENPRNLRQHAGLIEHHKTEIVETAYRLNRLELQGSTCVRALGRRQGS